MQLSVVLGGGLAPLIATALWTAGSTSAAVTCYIVAICALSTISPAVLIRQPSAEIPVPVPVG